MEISNKTLALFLVAAIVISLGGTIISLNKLNSLSTTGFATSTGVALLNITTSSSIKFVVSTIDFGVGSVNTSGSNQNCTMYVNDTSTITKSGCINFSASVTPYGPFFLENDGSTNLNVTLNSTKNSTEFIGGNYSIVKLQYAVSNNESGSCTGVLSNYAWTDANRTDMNICTNLTYQDSVDSLRVGIRVVVPYDAPSSNDVVQFIATGTGI